MKRIAKRATYTIGRLYILPDGSVERELIPGRRREDKRTVRCRVDESLLTTEHYFCDTLEPTWRNLLGIPLVLPDGVKGENTWTVGDKNAVRLVRE